MKKEYIRPLFDVVYLSNEDVVTVSIITDGVVNVFDNNKDWWN